MKINSKTIDIYLDKLIELSTKRGKVVLLERAFGRGTDFKCEDPFIN